MEFHETTKHSEFSLRMSAHYLDWDNKPHPFKVYNSLPSIPPPGDFPHPKMKALDAITTLPSKDETKPIDLGTLAEILFFSAGITRKMRTRAGVHYMRAAPATGALYPIELYLICGDVQGLDPGVYHFSPLDFTLVKLREGNHTSELTSSDGTSGGTWPVTIALTSLAWRNAWKYENRSYRHWFWDAGVIAANMLAVSAAEELPARIDVGFVDSKIDRLLGLTAGKEATVVMVSFGKELPHEASDQAKDLSELDLEVRPLSREETEYPLIWKTNRESELHTFEEVRKWRQGLKPQAAESGVQPSFQLQPLREATIPSLEETILRRGSTRKFAPKPITLQQLSTIIKSSTSQIPMDCLLRGESMIDFYFIANQIDGLPSGSYFFDRKQNAIGQLKAGRFRDMSGYLCLGQSLFSDASAVFFLMTDLGQCLDALGNRGYRAAQFEAGVRSGKIYLSSYAVSLGASGSTFYDDAVTEFFSPHAKDKSTMIAVGVGVPAYIARPGRVLTVPAK
jgi:SagB-type dehydrogenase family enzyme